MAKFLNISTNFNEKMLSLEKVNFLLAVILAFEEDSLCLRLKVDPLSWDKYMIFFHALSQ